MKIVVLGNCQASAVRSCVEFLTGFEAGFMSHDLIHKAFADGSDDAVKAMLENYDIVLTQSVGVGTAGTASTETVKRAARCCIGLPNILFTAFHPDQIYVSSSEGGPVLSPLGPYNSALTLLGYRAGYSTDETISLFRRDCYERLGFLGHWPAAQRKFEEQCRVMSFPGAQAFARWTRRGVFMHTMDHPKLFVMEDVARTALKLAGVPCRAESCCDYLHDGLMQQVWPVYPDIAACYSLPGSYVFRRESHPRPPLERYPSQMGLEAFVRGSYELYEPHGRDNMRAPMPDRWLADDAIVAALRPV